MRDDDHSCNVSNKCNEELLSMCSVMKRMRITPSLTGDTGPVGGNVKQVVWS